jgi:hypothetical protein
MPEFLKKHLHWRVATQTVMSSTTISQKERHRGLATEQEDGLFPNNPAFNV